jgi:S1-C subfamily serine protease
MKVLPVIAGAVAGAVIALLVSNGGTNKTVIEQIGGTPASAVPTASSTTTSGLSVNQIYKMDSPGVVDIVVNSVQQGSSNGFFSTPSQTTQDEGAGVVYDKQGDILTDEHVVANASSVTVNFQDGVSKHAKVLGTDPSTDIAVIRVEDTNASELHPIKFANSGDAQVGDPVVAIGSPFSLPETTTAGIVSAVGRTIQAPNGYQIPAAIQTDAPINPGNSGGPLLDGDGQVLGLNDQIQTSSGDSAGVGFATPGNTDVQVADQIISGKKVQHAYVGVSLSESTGSTPGAEIGGAGTSGSAAVVAGSPAAKAGLTSGDVITKVDDTPITDSDGFISVISGYKPGQTVTLTIVRNGKTSTVKVTLGVRPASAPTAG